MMTEPFALMDGLEPDKDVDEAELAKVANAIDDLDDRPRGQRRPGTFDHEQAFDRIADYQFSRKLKNDRKVFPKGPTEKRLAADIHAQETARAPSLQQQVLGKGANLPLKAGVGPGQPNRAGDVRATAQSMVLAGHPVDVPPVPGQPELPDAKGAAKLEPVIRKAQAQHGEKPDGIIRPGGPTQSTLSHLTAPQLDYLAGRDPKNPKPFTPPKPKMVAQTLNFRPTTIRTFEQDPETLPTIEEHEAAVDLLQTIGEREKEARARLAGKAEPDHRTPLEEALARGEITTARIEDRVEALARLAALDPGNREAARRLRAHLDVLADDAMRRAREQGVHLDPEEVRDRLQRLTEAATTGGTDMDAAGEILMLALDFAPVVGEAKSAYEAYELYQELQAARAAGDTEQVTALQASFLLAAAGAVPFLGKFAKGAKLAEKLGDTFVGRKVSQQAARHRLLKWGDQFDNTMPAHSAQSLFEPKIWQGLNKNTRNALEGAFTHAKKREGEALMRRTLEQAGFDLPVDGKWLRRYRVDIGNGTKEIRKFDDVARGKMRKVLGGLIVRLDPSDKAKGYEFKVGNSRYGGKQKKVDEAIEGGAKVKVSYAKRYREEYGKDGPEIDEDIQKLRVPLSAVPEDELLEDVTRVLKEKKIDADVIEQMRANIQNVYRLERELRSKGELEQAAKLTVAAVLGVTVTANLDESDES